ncbi:PrpR N-terminal domain-containing protein [Pigmentiphaga litoralis]|uniref:sigma-54-dependent Fis family transcriptional regulator n=1 Tax=Pigmentiphaga litoralis TaxID=516702 RepID=UPI003B42D635
MTSEPDLAPSAPVDIWGVSAFDLAELIALSAPAFAGRARVQIIDDHFEGAADKIRQRLHHAHCDVLLSAGANADYLRATFNLPVVTVRVGGYDVMRALTQARQLSGRMALLLHREVPAEIDAFLATFGIELEVRAYDTESEARHVVKKLAKQGVRVVIGAGLAMRVARDHGLAGVFLYSAASVAQAIEDAVQGVVARRREAAQQRTLSSVLAHLDEGVIAVDTQGRITAANRAADTLTGRGLGVALGRPLRDVIPPLDPASLFVHGESRRSDVHRFDQQSVAVDAVALFDEGRPAGVAYTLHAATAVASAFRKLRAHDKARPPRRDTRWRRSCRHRRPCRPSSGAATPLPLAATPRY